MITQNKLKYLFTYKNGLLFWRIQPRQSVNIGDIAGCIQGNGYRGIGIKGKKYKAHRLIFLYHHGYLPEFIDHKYGKEAGDYLWNLRPSTSSQNNQNSTIRKDNKSGVKGVSWEASMGRWRARIYVDGKAIHLGRFIYFEDAANAIFKAREMYHMEFANHG